MGYALLLFNWIIFFIELSRAFSEAICDFSSYGLSFLRTPPAKDVKDRVVVVTGAASALGTEICHRFARLGAQVIMLDIDEQANTQAANELRNMGNNKVFAFPCDVSVEPQVNLVAKKILKYFGKVDILINNATWWEPQTASPLIQSPSESIEKTLTVNLLSHFWATRAFLPSMIEKRSGHVVAISSMSGLMGTSKFSSFCASQHGILGAMSALSSELEDYDGITVSTVCPIVEGIADARGMLPLSLRKFFNLEILSHRETAFRIVDAIQRNREFVIVPKGFTILQFIEQMLPQKLSKYARELFLREIQSLNPHNHPNSGVRVTNGNSCH